MKANKSSLILSLIVLGTLTLTISSVVPDATRAQGMGPPTAPVTVENTPLPVVQEAPITGEVTVLGVPSVAPALPTNPFTGGLTLNSNDAAAVGASDALLGVTSITLSNFDANPQQVFFFRPVLNGGTACDDADIIGGGSPAMTVIVPADGTLHLDYPTPMVFPSSGARACIAFEVTTVLTGGSVRINVNGLLE